MQNVCLSARRSRPLSREESLSYQTCCRVFLSYPKDHPIQLPPTTFKGMWIIYSNPETHRSLNIVSMYIFSHLSLHWIFLIYYNHSFIYDFMYSSLFFSVFWLELRCALRCLLAVSPYLSMDRLFLSDSDFDRTFE